MLNARMIQEFVMFISRSFLKYPREAFFPFIYEYNISMVLLYKQIVKYVAMMTIGIGRVTNFW